MRLLIAPTLLLAAIVGLSTSANTQDPVDETPYRIVTSATVVPDLTTNRTNLYLETIDPNSGAEELWDVETYLDASSLASGMMLHISGDFSFSVDSTYDPFELTLATASDAVTVDADTYATSLLYAQLAASTAVERGFLQEISVEYKAFGTIQGIVPDVVTPEEEVPPLDDDAPPGPGLASCVSNCIDALPDKPADCEGAIHKWKCCVWEAGKDGCQRKCDCEKLGLLWRQTCYALALAALNFDLMVCASALPLDV